MRRFLMAGLAGVLAACWATVVCAGEVDFSPVHVYTNEPGLKGLGYHLGAGADVDGDGYEDFLVYLSGTYPYDYPTMVLLYSGFDRHLLRWWDNGVLSHEFGQDMTLADIDQDGYGDCLIANTMDPDYREQSGVVWIYSGRTGEIISVLHGETWNEYFGNKIAVVDDIDGDGWKELLVGAPTASTGGKIHGRVDLISPRTGVVLWSYEGTSSGDHLPRELANLGDVDGDGVSDFIVSCARTRVGGVRKGKVWVWSGRTRNLLYSLEGRVEYGFFGYKVEVLDDTDGDGVDDFAVGENDRLHVYSGADGHERFTVMREDPSGGLMFSVLEDVDGDGGGDLVLVNDGRLVVASGTDGRPIWSHRFQSDIYAAQGLGDSTGDGLPELLVSEGVWDDYGGRVYLFGADSLRRSQAPSAGGGSAPGIQLRIRAPGVAGRLAVLLFSLGSEDGTPLGQRNLPLDPGPLLTYSMVHPVLVPLDGEGRASFRLPAVPLPGLPFPNLPGLQAAFITLDPTSPDGLGAISNAEPVWEDSR